MDNLHQNTMQQPVGFTPRPAPQPRRVLPPEEEERRSFRGKVEYMGVGLLIYTFIIYTIYLSDMIAHMIIMRLSSATKAEFLEKVDEYEKVLYESAGSMIVAVVVGVLFLVLFFIKALPLKKIFAPHRKMTFGKLIMLVNVLMGCQIVFFYMDAGVEWLLNQVGYSLQQAIESSQAGSTTVSMFIYAGFIGPIVEEVVYRGFVMHTFERVGCGKFCSIFISALLFGIMHANPTQSIFATYVGIVFGYAAMEYGLGWSIALHIINNFLFGDVLTYAANKLPETQGAILSYGVLIVTFLAGLVILIVKMKKILAYIRENSRPVKYYGWAFSRISILAFIILNTFFAMLAFSKLEG